MAMQTGIGLSRIVLLAGAGYTGTILINNGKLSDLLGQLQILVQGLEKSGEQDGDSDGSDALADQVRHLTDLMRRMASRPTTVINGTSGGNATSLIVPIATLGALGYGYMWWKGLSLADLMYVTKKSMNTAISNLTKHLEIVTDKLSVAKKHLTQRIQDLNDKVEKQNEISKDIQKNVEEACEDLFKVEHNLKDLQNMIFGLDGKIDSLGYKQDITNIGLYYLCSLVDGRKGIMPESVQEQFKLGEKARHRLKGSSAMGLKDISDSLSGVIGHSARNANEQNGINNFDDQPRLLYRAVSAVN